MIRLLAVVLWFLSLGLSTLRAGSDGFFQAIEDGDTTAVGMFLDSGISPDSRGEKNTTALYCAIDQSQVAIANLLIARGADVNLTPPHGSTPLQLAIYRGYDSYKLQPKPGFPELIRTLLDKGANVNAADVDGNTPLIAAAEKDDSATLELLLDRGADLAHVNENGWTALERAVSYRRRTIAHKLVRLGAPLDEEQKVLFERYEKVRGLSHYFPLMLVGSLFLAGLMHRRLKALPKRNDPLQGGDDLPKLELLKCDACGGSASLAPGVAKCANCHEPVAVPPDYTETLKLREQTVKLTERAEKLWRRVHLVSVVPVRLALWAGAIAWVWWTWKGLFPLIVRDAFYNLMTFTGTMSWLLGILTMAAIAIALAGYAIYLGEVRRALPQPPEPPPTLAGEEITDCPNCHGKVEIGAGHIVGVCGYCGSEAYRVALARESRKEASKEREAATNSLYQAMFRVYEMRENAALAIPAAIVAIGLGLGAALWVILAFA